MDDGSGMDWYILTANHRVKKVSYKEWEKWRIDGGNRRVDQTFIDHVNISTVFLLTSMYPHIHFETMVFYESLNNDVEHYATWGEAVKGHKKIVAEVRSAMKEEKKP